MPAKRAMATAGALVSDGGSSLELTAPGNAERAGVAGAARAAAPTTAGMQRVEARNIVFVDYVEDRVRSRFLSVMLLTIIFLLATGSLVSLVGDNPGSPTAAVFASSPPKSAFLGVAFTRDTRVQILSADEIGLPARRVNVQLMSVRNSGSALPVDCSTRRLRAIAGTLEATRVADVCKVELAPESNATDEVGLARMVDFAVSRGPPGVYDFQFAAADVPSAAANASVTMFSRVARLMPLETDGETESLAPYTATVGQPITGLSGGPVQVLVLDKADAPVAGAQVIMFAWKAAFFTSDPDGSTAIPNARYGEQFALFDNAVSMVTGEDGIAHWPLDAQPTITGASAPYVWLSFYCEGVTLAWSNPKDKAAITLPQPPQLIVPTELVTTVASVQIATAPETEVVEGGTFATQPAVIIRDSNGAPVSGRTAMAVVAMENGEYFPLRNKDSLKLSRHKELVNAVSAPSDASGRAVFTDLGFQVAGEVGAFKIVFVCDGVESALTDTIEVTTTVATVVIVQSPEVLEMLSGDGSLNQDAVVGAIAVLRVLNAAGDGVPGKMAHALLLDAEYNFVNATSGAGGIFPVDLTDSALSTTSDADGFADTPVGIAYVTDAGSDLLASGARLVFAVDGVFSLPSARATISQDLAPPVDSNTTVFLPTLQQPTPTVTLDGTSTVTAQYMAVSTDGTPQANVRVRLVPIDGDGLWKGVVYPYRDAFWHWVDASPAPQPVDTSGDPGVLGITDGSGVVSFEVRPSRSAPGVSTCKLVPVVVEDGMTLSDDGFTAVAAFGRIDKVTITNPVVSTAAIGGDDTMPFNDMGELSPSDGGMVQIDFNITDSAGAGVASAVGKPVLNSLPINLAYAEYSSVKPVELTLSFESIFGAGPNTPPGNADVALWTRDGSAANLDDAYFAALQPTTGSDAAGTLHTLVTTETTGTFSYVLDVHGVRSKPVVFSLPATIASIEIVTQPKAHPHLSPSHPTLGGLVRVGNGLLQNPVVRAFDANGSPVEGYRISASAVNDDGSPAPCMLDVASDDVSNLFDSRISAPSEANGTAAFDQMLIFDSLTGCYRMRFAFNDGYSDPVYAPLSDPFCVTNLDKFEVTQQPSLTTSRGATFKQPLKVKRSRPYNSWIDSLKFGIVFTLVDGYKENVRRPSDDTTTAASAEELAEQVIETAGESIRKQLAAQVAKLTGKFAGATFPGALVPGGSAVDSMAFSPSIVGNSACIIMGDEAILGGCSVEVLNEDEQGVDVPGVDVPLDVELTLPATTWDNAHAGDQMTMRVFSPLVVLMPEAYDVKRSAKAPESGCAGAAGGTFGHCCDSDSECATGFVCETASRTCTIPCSTDDDCDSGPSTLEPMTGKPACDASTSTCKANSVIGWSLSPFCRYCGGDIRPNVPGVTQTVSWSGDAGPAHITGAVQAALTQLFSMYDAYCTSSADNAVLCGQLQDYTTMLITEVTSLCASNPAVLATCAGGFSSAAFRAALLTLVEFVASSNEPSSAQQAAVVRGAVDLLFTKAAPVGRTHSTSVLKISESPAELFVFVQPPDEVEVGDVFEVVAEMTIGTGAPLPNAPVTAVLSRARVGGSGVNVNNFIAVAQNSIQAPADPWAQPVLEAGRATMSTNSEGRAVFRLRISSAPDGEYTLQFTSGDMTSPYTNPFTVGNKVAKVELEGDDAAPASLVVSEYPHTFTPFVPRVSVLDANSSPIANVSASVDVYPLAVIDDAGLLARGQDLAASWDTLGAVQRASAFFKLIMQGSRKLELVSNTGANVDVDLGAPVLGPDGTVSFPHMQVTARASGTFVVVFAVRGIPSRQSVAIEVLTEAENAGVQAMITLAMRLVTCFFCGLILIGNSQWHHKLFVVSSVVLLAGVIAFTPTMVARQNLDGDAARTTTYAMYVALGVGMAGFLYVGLVEAAGKTHLLFPQRRRAAYVAYTKAIWTRPAQPKLAVSVLDPEADKRRRQLAQERSRCGVCESKAAEVSCMQCHEVFCRPCSAGVHRGRLVMRHVVVPGIKALGRVELARDHDAVQATTATSPKSAVQRTIAHGKASLHSLFKGDDSAAFFFPSKVLGAFAVSVLAILTLFVATLRVLQNVELFVGTSDARALRTAFTGIDALEELFYKTFQSDMLVSETEFAYAQAYRLHDEFSALSSAVLASMTFGMFMGTFTFILAWVWLLLDFRSQVMNGRRGRFEFDRSKIRVADASNYVGIQISNGLITFVILCILCSVATFPIAWHVSRDLILDNWLLILNLIWPALVNVVIKKGWGYFYSTSAKPYDHIARRGAYNAYDLFQTFLQMYTGIVTAIVRFVLVVVIALLTLPRLDRSPMPAWVERYLLLDTGSKAYHATVHQYCTFNNPIARTFAWIMEDLMRGKRVTDGGEVLPAAYIAKSFNHPGKPRVLLRWRLAVMLLRNPSLRQYRCRLSRRQVDEREAAKEKKKSGARGDGASKSNGAAALAGSKGAHEKANPLVKAAAGRGAAASSPV